jgi:hypothetical protein
MENLNLNGIMFNDLTAKHPFVVVDESARYYHRDNPESQTRLQRLSRKSVATYARLFDGADRYFLLSPVRWIRHVVTMFRYSRLVHGSQHFALKLLHRGPIRSIATALAPLGFLARYRKSNEVIIDIPYFEPSLTDGLPDLRMGEQ